MISAETGEILTRGVRPFVVTYKGKSRTVDSARHPSRSHHAIERRKRPF